MKFYEFVGTPTTGISLRRALADRIRSLPELSEDQIQVGPVLQQLLGFSDKEGGRQGFTADGIIVRCASALDAVKYYDNRPGFFYRIHGSNSFAATTRRGRWFTRQQRKTILTLAICDHFHINRRPTSQEVCTEILSRKFALKLRRRLRIRLEYCLLALKSRGNIWQRLHAVKTAAGLSGSSIS